MSRPTDQEAEQLAKKHDRDVVIVFTVGDDGQLHSAIYGKDDRNKKVARHLSNQGYVSIKETMNQFEPDTTPGYQVKHNEYGAVVYGEVPAGKVSELQQHLEKHRGLDMIDSKIADHLGATFVFTTNQGSKQWRYDLGITKTQTLEHVHID